MAREGNPGDLERMKTGRGGVWWLYLNPCQAIMVTVEDGPAVVFTSVGDRTVYWAVRPLGRGKE